VSVFAFRSRSRTNIFIHNRLEIKSGSSKRKCSYDNAASHKRFDTYLNIINLNGTVSGTEVILKIGILVTK